MNYIIEAFVSNPDGTPLPLGNSPYVKIAYNSDEPRVDAHMEELQRVGLRVLSVKSRPVYGKDDLINHTSGDRHGNQTVVDGKIVIDGENDGSHTE